MSANTNLIHRGLTSLPVKDHPLFYLRKYTIIGALVGIVLSWLTTDYYYGIPGPATFSIFLLVLSILVCLVDLASYAQRKAQDADTEPKWPSTVLTVVDFVLAVLLIVTFWFCVNALELQWAYTSGEHLLGAYSALAGLLCSFLHAKSFWRQLMARKKQAWIRELPKEPCARCGYTGIDEAASRPQQQQPLVRESRPPPQANVFPYAGPSTDFRQANVLTPERSESVMEEGLLIGSDYEGGYQTIGRDEETTIEQPESVVVVNGKAKRKKKAAKRCDSSSSEGHDPPCPAGAV